MQAPCSCCESAPSTILPDHIPVTPLHPTIISHTALSYSLRASVPNNKILSTLMYLQTHLHTAIVDHLKKLVERDAESKKWLGWCQRAIEAQVNGTLLLPPRSDYTTLLLPLHHDRRVYDRQASACSGYCAKSSDSRPEIGRIGGELDAPHLISPPSSRTTPSPQTVLERAS